jgi:hypothetical protein
MVGDEGFALSDSKIRALLFNFLEQKWWDRRVAFYTLKA